MGDTVFHIVESDGGIDIVQLAPVKVNVNSKSNNEVDPEYNVKKDNCGCVMCFHPLPTSNSSNVHPPPTSEDENKSYAPKTYTRVKAKSKTKEDTDSIINSPLTLKPEPEIEFVDVGTEEAIKNISTFIHKNPEQDIIPSDATSTITIKTEPTINIVDTNDSLQIVMETGTQTNLHKTPASKENHSLSKSQSSEQLKKSSCARTPFTAGSSNTQTDCSAEQFSSSFHNTTGPMLELTTRNIECNICGMVFLKSEHQLKTLKTHFLQHKISFNEVIKRYSGVKYRVDQLTKKSNSYVPQPKTNKIKDNKAIESKPNTNTGGQYRVDKLNVNGNGKVPAQEKPKFIEKMKEVQINNSTLKLVVQANGKRDLENNCSLAEKNKPLNNKVPVRAILPDKSKPIAVQPLAIGPKDNIKSSSEKPLLVRVASSQLKNNLDINYKTLKLIKIKKPGKVPASPISPLVQPYKKKMKKECEEPNKVSAMKSSTKSFKVSSPIGDSVVKSCNEITSSRGMDLVNDDDIEIVEEKPDVIVIDDNDEGILKCYEKIS